MAYTFEQLLAADPSNPANIAQNASIVIFAPGDATQTPLAITDTTGSPLPNPIQVNANGFGPAFMHATLDRVAWAGGGFTAFMTSYEGMKAEAVDARAAAQAAQAEAAVAGANAAAEAATALAGAVADAEAAQAAAESAAALVGAPADSAIAAAVSGSGTATKAALNATILDGATDVVGDLAIPKTKDAGDTFADVTRRLQMTDAAGAKGSQINFEHFADGSGRPTGVGAGQTYAVDIHNNPGAKSAIVVHQYSNAGPAVRLDNTGTGTMLLIAQTNNPAKNPESVDGGNATGNAITIVDSTGAVWTRFDGRGSLIMVPPADASQHAIDVTTNAAATKRALKLTGNSAAPIMEIQANAGSTGQYPLLINGYTHGAQFSTSQSGGFVLGLTRTNTGSGDVANLRNDGTGKTILFRQNTTSVSQVNANGEYENLTAGNGIILKSPDGTRYKITVANGGALTVAPA